MSLEIKLKKLLILGALTGVLAGFANAVAFTLADGNAVVNGTDTDGLTNWITDGIDDLFNQDYYWRIGNTSGEAQVGDIGPGVITQLAANIVNVSYTHAAFRIDMYYSLIGGAAGSGTSDIGEIVRVTNLSNGALNFHLFEYDDFDINGSAGGDFASSLNSSTIGQSDGPRRVTVGATPPPDSWQIAPFNGLLVSLNDATPTNLNNTGSGLGPDDLTFAMQWDRTIQAGGSFLMSKNKRVETVPEPATMAALGLGLAAMVRRRAKK